MTVPLDPIPLGKIRAARERIAAVVTPSPLIPLELDTASDIYLKLENLHPIGAFKIRGAANAMLRHRDAVNVKGVYTASAGNMGLGVAWMARHLRVPCHVVVPDHAPRAKLARLEALGASVISVAFEEWWRVLETHHYPGLEGLFLHPVCNEDVIAGNATVALEILEQCAGVERVFVPYGGGGLSCGIASAMRAVRPQVRTYACEVETAAPLAASLDAGEVTPVSYTATFVDGIGGRTVLREMWPLARELLAGSVVTSLDQIAAGVRLLATHARVVAEGAGAASVAAALTGAGPPTTAVCVVSGGNIDPGPLATILAGRTP